MITTYRLAAATLLAVAAMFSGCGGGGGGGGSVAGIGGTGKIASGPITAFGSIFVNGVEYETDAADIVVNGTAGLTQQDLSIGMVVTVVGKVDDSGRKGTAEQVTFNAEVKGPVSGLIDDGNTKRFSILGTEVVVDSATTSFDDISFAALADGKVIEVSGFRDASGAIQATWVEKKEDTASRGTEVELKGVIRNAGMNSFMIDGIRIEFDNDTNMDDMPGGIRNGVAAEVKGVLIDAGTVRATRIEQESEGLGDEAEDASVEGLITNFMNNGNFRVNGQKVNASSANIKPSTIPLANGLRVEIEGPISGGTLIADKVEIKSGDVKIEATVSSVSTSASTLAVSFGGASTGEVIVSVNNRTEFEDDTGGTSSPGLGDIRVGDFVSVRGLEDGAGGVIADKVKIDKPDEFVLQGPIDVASGTAVTILGMQVLVDANTEFQDRDENMMSGPDFLSQISKGDIVKVIDEDGDGIADEIDQEND